MIVCIFGSRYSEVPAALMYGMYMLPKEPVCIDTRICTNYVMSVSHDREQHALASMHFREAPKNTSESAEGGPECPLQ